MLQKILDLIRGRPPGSKQTNKQTNSLEDWPKNIKWKSIPRKSCYQVWLENGQKKKDVQILLNEC